MYAKLMTKEEVLVYFDVLVIRSPQIDLEPKKVEVMGILLTEDATTVTVRYLCPADLEQRTAVLLKEEML